MRVTFNVQPFTKPKRTILKQHLRQPTTTTKLKIVTHYLIGTSRQEQELHKHRKVNYERLANQTATIQ